MTAGFNHHRMNIYLLLYIHVFGTLLPAGRGRLSYSRRAVMARAIEAILLLIAEEKGRENDGAGE